MSCGCTQVCTGLESDCFHPAPERAKHSPKPSESALSASHPSVLAAEASLRSLRARFQTLIERFASKRAQTIDGFARIRETISSSERAALAEFDGHTANIVKSWTIAIDAMDVSMYQLKAMIDSGCAVDAGMPAVHLADIDVEIAIPEDTMQSMLRSCWKIVVKERPSDRISDDCSEQVCRIPHRLLSTQHHFLHWFVHLCDALW
jgi:hypothetical protein